MLRGNLTGWGPISLYVCFHAQKSSVLSRLLCSPVYGKGFESKIILFLYIYYSECFFFFLPFMYYLAIKVAHEIGVIMKKLALCYHNTFVERLLQQHEQDE